MDIQIKSILKNSNYSEKKNIYIYSKYGNLSIEWSLKYIGSIKKYSNMEIWIFYDL